MRPGTARKAYPEHQKARSPACEPFAEARCSKTSMFLKEIIDFRCRVGPSRPKISMQFVPLGILFLSKSIAQVTLKIQTFPSSHSFHLPNTLSLVPLHHP